MMSIKLISEQLLLGGPRAGNLDKLDLFIPGELPRQKLTFSRRIVVFASPNNPGALRVAEDLVLAMGNCIEVTIDETNAMITHFLLYLNDHTYSEPAGAKLAEELRRAMVVSESRKSTIEIVTVHENDPERGGCDFGIFFDGRTPKDLVDGGIYNVRALYALYLPLSSPLPFMQALPSHTTCNPRFQAIAQALFSGRFWPVSAALVAKAMGATTTTGSRSRSFTTESALRAELKSSLRAAGKRVMSRRDRGTLADPLRLLRKASDLYGWDSDGAHATRDRPGREFLRGPGSVSAQSRRDTTNAETLRSEHTGSSETTRSEDPGPSAGVETVDGPELLVATGPMQRRPAQARVGYPASLPSPRWSSVVRV